MPSRSVTLLDTNGNRVESGNAITNANTSAAASTPVILGTLKNLGRWEQLIIRFLASNALGGGSCDYVLQRLVDGPNGSTWDDFLYLGQQAAGATFDVVAVISNTTDINAYSADKGDVTWVRHDENTDATLVLAAGERRPGPTGPQLRVIARTLAGVNAAAVTNLTLQGMEKP